MNFDIEVVQVSETKDKTNARGGKFAAVEVVYKKDGKVEAKSFPDWANKDIYPSLLALKAGDSKTVTTEKVNGYWQWLGISDNSQGNPAGQKESPVSQTTSKEYAKDTGFSVSRSSGKVVGSNYETSAERALRQKYIIAQSSISSAIASAKPGTLDPGQILELADTYYNYVLGKSRDLSDIQSDIPE